jgi:versiconal hemiacetal acetate esterase
MALVAAHPDWVPEAYAEQYTAYTENGPGVPIIDATTMKTFFEVAGADPMDVKVFVSLSEDLKQFPPTYIATCGKDPLRNDGEIFKAMLKEEGVKTKSNQYEGQLHCFWMIPGISGGEEFLQDVVKGTQWALGQSWFSWVFN